MAISAQAVQFGGTHPEVSGVNFTSVNSSDIPLHGESIVTQTVADAEFFSNSHEGFAVFVESANGFHLKINSGGIQVADTNDVPYTGILEVDGGTILFDGSSGSFVELFQASAEHGNGDGLGHIKAIGNGHNKILSVFGTIKVRINPFDVRNHFAGVYTDTLTFSVRSVL